jgi:hypothetical protein
MYILYCYRVENVSSVTLNAENVRFKSTEDHSKWATAYKDNNTAKDWVCIGDINRMVRMTCTVYRHTLHTLKELGSGPATAANIQRTLKFSRKSKAKQRNIRR